MVYLDLEFAALYGIWGAFDLRKFVNEIIQAVVEFDARMAIRPPALLQFDAHLAKVADFQNLLAIH
jgi:hypothetical protein